MRTWTRRHGLGAGLGLFLVLLAQPVWSQASSAGTGQPSSRSRDLEARNLFEAGRVAHDDGRFEDALGYFRKAHELSGRSELLYNVGTTAERLRMDDVALEAFERYLSELPNADNRANVEARVTILRAAVEERRRTTQSSNPAWIAPMPANADTMPADSESFTGRWWFWAAVGGVVAAGVITTAVLLTPSSSDPQAPLPGRDGVVVATLRGW